MNDFANNFAAQPRHRGRWRHVRRGVFGGAMAFALAGIPASVAFAQPHFGHWGGAHDIESAQEMAALRVKHMLKRVDATPEQLTKIKAITEAAVKDTFPLREQRAAARADAHKLLAAPAIDRAAVEAVRARQVALHDQASKRMMQALFDAAEVLTPAQREKLAKNMAERGGRGHM
ncbi:MAG: Spy/CpxP family protein refolding chaperone [Alphaproteobacteria bacterium]